MSPLIPRARLRGGLAAVLAGVAAAMIIPPMAIAGESKNAYFGDLHIHTQNSADAYLFNSRATPDDAYAYAKGEVITHPAGFPMALAGGPLDFAAVTDHGEMLGVLGAMSDPDHPASRSEIAGRLRDPDRSAMVAAYFDIMADVAANGTASIYRDPDVIRSAWEETRAAAERHNAPGRFTTFVGYEYSSAPENQNLHRNVIFSSARVPDAPFTAVHSDDPEDVWVWLDGLRATGIDGLAIPHNANVSNGLMFRPRRFTGEPIDAAYAELRRRNEPIVEISQVKGTSETHPSLSPADEWAGFELYDNLIASPEIAMKSGGFVREAYRVGLTLHDERGFNPFVFGLIGSSDTHNGGGSTEESHYSGKVGTLDASAAQRGSIPSDTRARFGGDDGPHAYRQWNAAGLAGVWATENTREALFDAMRRRETFATSGPRIRVDFRAGQTCAGLAAAPGSGEDRVPMGSVLITTGAAGPCFQAWAAMDPLSAPLDRLQIVKGWSEDGRSHEAVIDLACAGGRLPDPESKRCPDGAARVDPADCSFDTEAGASELRITWRDPLFRPDAAAFYYVRVLENPTCRWSTWDALRAGVPPDALLPVTIQERAWSSPIWYLPSRTRVSDTSAEVEVHSDNKRTNDG